MKKTFITLVCLLAALSLQAGVETGTSTPDIFLRIVRNGHPQNTWMMMSGTVEHLRKDENAVEAKIRIDLRFTADRVIAKITVNNNGGFTVGQLYDSSTTTILQNDKTGDATQSLENIGLRPEDLTMSFLYWNFIKELPRATVRNVDCRVFELASPDNREKAIVYIGAKYFVAMKAEFVKASETEPYRTLTVDSFEQSGDLWTVSSFIISGPGWKTKVTFDSVKMGYVKDGVPKELFN